MAYGKAIELFLVDGDANGLITAELSNWNGKAIKSPRTDVKDCTRHDITEAGVYFCSVRRMTVPIVCISGKPKMCRSA